MRQINLTTRFRYQFDNLMARGTRALVLTLFLLTLLLIVSITTVLYLFDSNSNEDDTHRSFSRILWEVFNHTFDPGSLEDTQGNLLYLGGMFLATLCGIFIVSALIGIIATAFNNKLEELRKGHSFVAESGHTLILGWSSAIFTIIRQLVLSRADQSSSAIVILADYDKVEMEDEIRSKVGSTGRTRIVCRTGEPTDFDDLEITNLNQAYSIIVLSAQGSKGSSGDVQVIKTLLALIQNPRRRAQPYHIVTQLYDAKNQAIVQMIGKDEVLAFRVGGVLGYMIVESIRQVRLSRAITELLQFEGAEIYFREEPDIVSKTFGEAILMYEDSTLIGLYLPGNEFLVNPPMDKKIAPGTQLVAITESEETFKLSGHQHYLLDSTAMRVPSPHSPQPQRLLILGWNEESSNIINRLDRYMIKGSCLLVVGNEPNIAEKVTNLAKGLTHLDVTFRSGDIANRALLDQLDIPSYDRVVVLSPLHPVSAQEADAQTIITLLHLRDISERSKRKFPIVTELMEESNLNLARIAQVDDVIVSSQLVSLVLAQMSQDKRRLPALLGLIDPDGQNLKLKGVEDYVALGIPVNFYTVIESAKRWGHLVLGYCVEAQVGNESQNFGVRLNPNKAHTVTFIKGDLLIVVAKDEF